MFFSSLLAGQLPQVMRLGTIVKQDPVCAGMLASSTKDKQVIVYGGRKSGG